jgi:hypothetical protein
VQPYSGPRAVEWHRSRIPEEAAARKHMEEWQLVCVGCGKRPPPGEWVWQQVKTRRMIQDACIGGMEWE